ncbi:hypothetical protein [Amycolatopsis eburnea]|uniref:hypothetical protein n=1 Tax=Amycolatopsis eburnea TaxID=2267691 RepID=UPI0013153A90|nr:hypothetical protein [Amycolatopsis eburnea]
MRLVRLERQQSRVADDIRAALASLGRGSTVIGGIALIGVGSVADRPIEAVVLLPHGVIIVIGVDLPDPALRLEAPLGAPWVADGWPLVADDDAVNPATEALDISQACEHKIATLVPGTAPVGTIIAVGPYVETVDQPARDLAGPVRVLHPTPTTMLAATVSLATAHRPRSVDQVRALIRGLAPDAPEFSDDILVGEGFSRFTDDSPPESLWDSAPAVPLQASSSGSVASSGGSDWRTATPVPVEPVVAREAEPAVTSEVPLAEVAPEPDAPVIAESEPTAPAETEPESPAGSETALAKPTAAEPPAAAAAPAEAAPAEPIAAPEPPAAAAPTPAAAEPEPPAAPTAAPDPKPSAAPEPEPPAAAAAPAQAAAEPEPLAEPDPEPPAAPEPEAPTKATPGPKLPLALEIALPQATPAPETAPEDAERTEVLPAPAFPGAKTPHLTQPGEPGPSTPDTERTERLRTPPSPHPREPGQPRPAGPVRPSPRPRPETASRTVRWLPLAAIGLLVLLVVAAIAVATTGDDTAAAPTGPPTPATQPPPASPTTAAPAQSLQFALRAADADQRCASHAFGDAQASLQQTSCSGVRRASYAATVDGRPGAVSVGIVEFPDASQAAAFKAVADTPGGGGILDLATETGKWGDTAPPRFENAAYASKVEGTSVRLVQAVWAPGPSTPDDPGLARAAKAALDLPAR